MTPLYPEIKPYKRHMLEVDDTHTLYIDESGTPDGIPILFIHGGPGAGCGKYDRRYYDPQKYRIILFDQRGAGRSTPHSELAENNTHALIGDIEKIRKHLNIEKWVLFGGSWGSTLALLYAESHPEHVSGMVLRGIFLCRQADISWFYQNGADRIFPDYWADFVQVIPEAERNNILQAYYTRLTSDNEIAKMAAAKAWSLWEARCATLRPHPDVVKSFTQPHTAMALARIEAHYFVNNTFIEEDQILKNSHKLEGIPGVIVHGRYDTICTLDNAYALHKHWPGSELQIIRDAGHSAQEPSIADALVKATNTMAELLVGDGDELS